MLRNEGLYGRLMPDMRTLKSAAVCAPMHSCGPRYVLISTGVFLVTVAVVWLQHG